MRTLIFIEGKTKTVDILHADYVIHIFGDDFVYLKNRYVVNGCSHVYPLKDLPQHIIANEGVNQKPSTKFDAVWGTYGKSGKEPLVFKRLMDLDSEHLQAIARTQVLSVDYRNIIVEILKDRKVLP